MSDDSIFAIGICRLCVVLAAASVNIFNSVNRVNNFMSFIYIFV